MCYLLSFACPDVCVCVIVYQEKRKVTHGGVRWRQCVAQMSLIQQVNYVHVSLFFVCVEFVQFDTNAHRHTQLE